MASGREAQAARDAAVASGRVAQAARDAAVAQHLQLEESCNYLKQKMKEHRRHVANAEAEIAALRTETASQSQTITGLREGAALQSQTIAYLREEAESLRAGLDFGGCCSGDGVF